MARVTQSNLPEKVGYMLGKIEGISDDVKESKEEILREFAKMHEEFMKHSDSDDRRFKEQGEDIREVRNFQNKQKWMWIGICLTCGVLSSSAALAIKFI